jgi:hypothetical protein
MPQDTVAPAFVMPDWMKPFARLIENTGDAYSGEPPDEHFVQVVEAMMNRKVNARINLPVAMLQIAVESQVLLLKRLHAFGLLEKL